MNSSTARTLYFRTTGRAFNAVDPPITGFAARPRALLVADDFNRMDFAARLAAALDVVAADDASHGELLLEVPDDDDRAGPSVAGSQRLEPAAESARGVPGQRRGQRLGFVVEGHFLVERGADALG